MKKLLGILVLGLLWCNVGFAYSEQQAKKEMSGRELAPIEGIWLSTKGNVFAIKKTSGENYVRVVIHHSAFSSGTINHSFNENFTKER